MARLSYEIDPHNRLVVKKTNEKTGLSRFRRVLQGQFKTGPDNSLIYHLKIPMPGLGAEIKAPHQLKLKGSWSLTKNHDLKLALNKWRRQTVGDELTLQGEIVAVEAGALLFALTTRSKKDLSTRYLLKLEGAWRADGNNRLAFRVNKGRGQHDTLVFNGIWEVDKHHRIVYTYEKAALKRKEKLNRSLTFKGFWDINRRNRLSYELGLDGKSGFDFRCSQGLLAENYIKYELGIGLAKKQPLKRLITLFGRWRFKKDTGLLFEIDYEAGKTKAIVFGAKTKLGKRNSLEFRLKDKRGRDLELSLKLSRKLFKDRGEAFLKLGSSEDESSVYLGAAGRW